MLHSRIGLISTTLQDCQNEDHLCPVLREEQVRHRNTKPLNSKRAMLLAHLTKYPSQGPSCMSVAIMAGSLLMFIVLRQLGAFMYVPMSTPHSVLLV